MAVGWLTCRNSLPVRHPQTLSCFFTICTGQGAAEHCLSARFAFAQFAMQSAMLQPLRSIPQSKHCSCRLYSHCYKAHLSEGNAVDLCIAAAPLRLRHQLVCLPVVGHRIMLGMQVTMEQYTCLAFTRAKLTVAASMHMALTRHLF